MLEGWIIAALYNLCLSRISGCMDYCIDDTTWSCVCFWWEDYMNVNVKLVYLTNLNPRRNNNIPISTRAVFPTIILGVNYHWTKIGWIKFCFLGPPNSTHKVIINTKQIPIITFWFELDTWGLEIHLQTRKCKRILPRQFPHDYYWLLLNHHTSHDHDEYYDIHHKTYWSIHSISFNIVIWSTKHFTAKLYMRIVTTSQL